MQCVLDCNHLKDSYFIHKNRKKTIIYSVFLSWHSNGSAQFKSSSPDKIIIKRHSEFDSVNCLETVRVSYRGRSYPALHFIRGGDFEYHHFIWEAVWMCVLVARIADVSVPVCVCADFRFHSASGFVGFSLTPFTSLSLVSKCTLICLILQGGGIIGLTCSPWMICDATSGKWS